MKPLLFTLLLALALPSAAVRAHAQMPSQEPPYSCRLYYDQERRCAFDPKCDRRVNERLRRECLRDGGRP